MGKGKSNKKTARGKKPKKSKKSVSDRLRVGMDDLLQQLSERNAATLRLVREQEALFSRNFYLLSGELGQRMTQLEQNLADLQKKSLEHEEEADGILSNQNEMLQSIGQQLSDIHEKLEQLSSRNASLVQRISHIKSDEIPS